MAVAITGQKYDAPCLYTHYRLDLRGYMLTAAIL